MIRNLLSVRSIHLFSPVAVQLPFSSRSRLQSGEDLALTLATSLLPDPEGYTLRFSRKNEADQMQFAVVFSQAGTSPDWVYSYR